MLGQSRLLIWEYTRYTVRRQLLFPSVLYRFNVTAMNEPELWDGHLCWQRLLQRLPRERAQTSLVLSETVLSHVL